MEKESVLKKSESALVARKIYIEKMFFERRAHNDSVIKFCDSNIGKKIETIDNNVYKCSLRLNMCAENDEAVLEIVVSGIFELETQMDEDMKKVVITKNTMAILFPYLRSQVTLLTAQPDVTPVVLPPININALLENMNNE